MRAALIIVAILALAGFLAVAVVLPQMAGSESREAAQALRAGADGARAHIGGGEPHAGASKVDHRAERRHPRLEREERDRGLDHAHAARRRRDVALPRL